MEKLRNSRQTEFRFGLLIFLLLNIFFSGNAFSLTYQEIKSLVIRPQSNIFFTNQELCYVLEIPEVLPAQVQTELSPMKEGVTFISSRRMELFTDNESSGTRIEFWFSFKNDGVGEIPPLYVKIKDIGYYIPFEKIQLYENPKTIAPRLIVDVKGSKEIYQPIETNSRKNTVNTISAFVSDTVEFTVYIQYAVQIKQFGWEIPKDSLFEEVKRFDFGKGKIKYQEFSQEKIPVATFRWTPLKEGNFSLPNVRLLAVAYSGRTLELGLPDCQVQIKKNPEAAVSEKKDPQQIFAYALGNPQKEDFIESQIKPNPDDLVKIASLREKERHSLFSISSIRRKRVILEQRNGIAASPDEPSIPLWYIFFFIFVFLTVAVILLFVFRKKILSVILSGFAIVFAFLSLISGILISEKHGVVKGGDISPVPEETALSKTAVTSGTLVKIKQQVQNWYYIEYNENGGWIKKENIIPIKDD